MTPVQYALLKVLWERDGRSGAELGERLQLDSATITGVLDRLERAGLAERRADPRDRRVNRIALTAEGRALQVSLDREMDALNAAWFERLGAGDAARLRAALGALGRVGATA